VASRSDEHRTRILLDTRSLSILSFVPALFFFAHGKTVIGFPALLLALFGHFVNFSTQKFPVSRLSAFSFARIFLTHLFSKVFSRSELNVYKVPLPGIP
jgi:hypothetical protein